MIALSIRFLFAVLGILAIMAVGGLLPFWVPGLRRHLSVTLSAAAGIMLGTAVLHLYPEATQILGATAGVAFLLGFVILYLFERFVTVHICETHGCAVHHLGIAAFFGLSVHTLVNGIALGAGWVEGFGGLVFFAIAAHKLPEAFSLTAILLHEGYTRRQIAWMSLLFMSMIPLGALIAGAAVGFPASRTAGWALGFSAGTFLHIAVSDLLPEVHKATSGRVAKIAAFLIGIALTTLID
ncbi:MAG: ZIP family metal transporter [Deltaproteobacteria bacterium]|nr:ZIP family metal transporter [Deltaproteobacteria bacterium]